MVFWSQIELIDILKMCLFVISYVGVHTNIWCMCMNRSPAQQHKRDRPQRGTGAQWENSGQILCYQIISTGLKVLKNILREV